MNTITLNFINQSEDKSNLNIVFFQKNISENDIETAVAWKVIKNCKPGEKHSIKIPIEIKIGVCDAKGHEIVKPDFVKNGHILKVIKDPAGHRLAFAGKTQSDFQVQLINALESGSIDANIYKDGKLLATKKGIQPSENELFQILPSIGVGVVPHIQEGQIMDSATLSSINTTLNLYRLDSADLIMTGGGPCQNSTPFQFQLQNVKITHNY